MSKKKQRLTNIPLLTRPLRGAAYEEWRKPLDVFSLDQLQRIAVDAARQIEVLQEKNQELWQAYEDTYEARQNAPKARLSNDPIAKAKAEIEHSWRFCMMQSEGKMNQAKFAREICRSHPCITNPERTITSWARKWKKSSSSNSSGNYSLPPDAGWYEAARKAQPRIYGLLNCDPFQKWVFNEMYTNGKSWGELGQMFTEAVRRKQLQSSR